MRPWLISLVHTRALEVALAVGLGYAVAKLVDDVAIVAVTALAQHVPEETFSDEEGGLQNLFSIGVYLLNFKVGSTVIFYGDVLASTLALTLLVLVATVVVRVRDRALGLCPFCASRIPHASTHCAYCGSGIAPGAP